MADPFYSNKWNPFHHVYYPQATIQPRSTKPKIVNIPVRFGTDGGAGKQTQSPAAASTSPKRVSKASAAVAIQKAARGFLVRKNLRLVRKVESEAAAIEQKVREDGDRVLLDPQERLRVSEELMALLLRLDSVRGVRDYRKKVIGRVLRLQEEVDSISGVSNYAISTTQTADRGCPGVQAHKESSSIVHGHESFDPQLTEQPEIREMGIDVPAEVVWLKGIADSTMEADDMVFNNHETDDQDESKSRAEEDESPLDPEVGIDMAGTGVDENVRAVVESPKRKSENLGIGNGEGGTAAAEEDILEDDEEGETVLTAELSEEERGLRKMMEKMAAENESLKLMLARLCETSAEQCRLMEGLADRISHLERLTHRKDRRKKRRNGSTCAALHSAK